MSEHKCNSCFYMQNERSRNPCNVCEGYNKYVNRNIYIHQPDTVAISTWDNEDVFNHSCAKDKDGSIIWATNGVERMRIPAEGDYVHSPKHYTAGKYEVIDVIEDWNLNFRLANTIKYIARHQHKGKPLEDLKKALWYLQREIDKYGTDA